MMTSEGNLPGQKAQLAMLFDLSQSMGAHFKAPTGQESKFTAPSNC